VGTAGVQVAGDFSLDRALASFTAIEREYPEFRKGPLLIVRKVNRSRGWAPLYQILIPAADQRAANEICRRLESTDGSPACGERFLAERFSMAVETAQRQMLLKREPGAVFITALN
jgi:hypothetical protein